MSVGPQPFTIVGGSVTRLHASPLSAAVQSGNLLFVSGQVGMRDGRVGQGIEEQTRLALENIRDILRHRPLVRLNSRCSAGSRVAVGA